MASARLYARHIHSSITSQVRPALPHALERRPHVSTPIQRLAKQEIEAQRANSHRTHRMYRPKTPPIITPNLLFSSSKILLP